MRRIVSFILALFLVFTAMPGTRNSIAQDSELLTNRELVKHNISIGGQGSRYVVYYAWDDEQNKSLFVYDLVEKKETLVSKSCKPMLDYQTNCVNEKYFAYLEFTGTSRFVINILYFETLTAKKIANESAQRFSLNVSGDYASWAEYEGSSNPGVYYCKLNEENPQPTKIHNVTLGTWNYISMSTYQDVTKIVYDDPESGDIFLFDTSKTTETKIVSEPNWDSLPFIFRNKVFYNHREIDKNPGFMNRNNYPGALKVLDLDTKTTETILEFSKVGDKKNCGHVNIIGNPDKCDYLYFVHNMPQANESTPTIVIYSLKPDEGNLIEKVEDNVFDGKMCHLEAYQQNYSNELFAYSKYAKIEDRHVNELVVYSQDTKAKTKQFEFSPNVTSAPVSDLSISDNKLVFPETLYDMSKKVMTKKLKMFMLEQ